MNKNEEVYNRTKNFVEMILRIQAELLGENLFKKVKRSLLDYIGVTLAGTTALKEKLDKYM